MSGRALPREKIVEQAIRDLISDYGPAESSPALTILAALVGIGEDVQFDGAVLEALTPEDVLRLDLLANEIDTYGRGRETAEAIRRALLRRVH